MNQKAYAEDKSNDPHVVRARVDEGGKTFSFFCKYCRERHTHGAGPSGGGGWGHRHAHCHVPSSPYRTRGYILVPVWFERLGRVYSVASLAEQDAIIHDEICGPTQDLLGRSLSKREALRFAAHLSRSHQDGLSADTMAIGVCSYLPYDLTSHQIIARFALLK